MPEMEFILELAAISKQFSGVTVLEDVDFKVRRGEVRGMVGANGAGKSTLMKIIGGVHKPTTGKIRLNGQLISLESPKDAQRQGISVIYQELSLIPTLDVLANVYIGREKINRLRFIDTDAMLAEYQAICEELQFRIPPFVKAASLSISQQQMVEIVKAISADSDLIIMDEPTASLTDTEKANLFQIINRLQQRGKTILYISHMLEELFILTDNITVMKDGRIVGTYSTAALTKPKVASLMTGQENTGESMFKKRDKVIDRTRGPVLEVNNVRRTNILRDINFQLYQGEILGIAGLMGSGRTELCRVLYGLDRIDRGEILINGQKTAVRSPHDAIAHGIGLIPEDRKNLGLIQKHEVYKNATIIQLDQMLRGIFISYRKERAFTHQAIEKLSIRVNDMNGPVKTLSGGNQQKIVVAKWLGLDLKVLIFDEPTKGIDVQAKEDIFQMVDDFAQKGVSVIFISSDLEEVLRVADRILVMRQGSISAEFSDREATTQNVMCAALNV